MFSSNVGFRRRTVSEGYSQLLLPPPPPSSSKRSSRSSHRHSLDELASSSSTAVKRVVLTKHSGESASTRSGLADRIARSEVENINGFWSRRLSGQRRSHPSSPKQTEPDVAQWRREARGTEGTVTNAAERGQTSVKPRGPRPLSKASVSSSTQRSSHLVPSGMLELSAVQISSKVMHRDPMVSVHSAIRTDVATPKQSSTVVPQALSNTKGSNTSASGRGKFSGLTYRPLLPPGLPVPGISPEKVEKKSNSQTQNKSVIREKDKRRFALDLALSKLVGGKKASPEPSSQREHQSTALTLYAEKKYIPLLPPLILPSSITIPLIPSIPIPPIPDTELPGAYVSRSRSKSIRSVKSARSVKSTKSAKSSKTSKSAKSSKRKSASRKRKTGLARIVVELAKGEKVVTMDAEAIHEAAQVRDILEQLRQMKAS